MAISIYTGAPGSGKTYEVVRYVIAVAISKGRRVVTNVAGVNPEAIQEFAVEKLNGDYSKIGEVVGVTDTDLEASEFFSKTVKPGDLVVVDECWRYWGADRSIPDPHLEFFRKHRHFVDQETGVSSDLVLISQSVSDIHRKLKVVIEFSFRAKKLKSLGLSSSYVVEMWEGSNQRKKPFSTQNRRYDAKVFPLYKSYSGGDGGGRELTVDSRSNILLSWRFMFVIPACLIFFLYAIWHVVSFFSPPDKSADVEPVVVADKGARVATVSVASVTVPQSVPKIEPLSRDWRLSGFVAFGDRRAVILINNAGRVRYASPSGFSFSDGRPISGVIDGERVTPWTGSLSSGSMAGVSQLVGFEGQNP